MKKVGLKIELFLVVIVATILIFLGTPILVKADVGKEYQITNNQELKREIKQLNLQENITQRQKNTLKENTSPEVLSSYMNDKMDKAMNKFDSINIEDIKMTADSKGNEQGEKIVDLGEGAYMKLSVSDKEEMTPLQNVQELVVGILEKKVYADGSNTVTKGYGNRYFTASCKIVCAIGWANLSLENHYNLSSNGIKERYGTPDISSLSYGGTVSRGKCKITDATATKPGNSNTNMHCNYYSKWDVGGVKLSRTDRISTVLSYKSIDKSKKKITLVQKWSHS